MIVTRLVRDFNHVLRSLSPTEWFVRWLGLPKSDSSPQDRGLVLIQIDGLSRPQLTRALNAGRMPFLKSLLNREHYQVHDLYSGLPSSTPSVQGELFYGERCAVPAFGFRDHRSGHVVSMFSRDAASDVEGRLHSASRKAALVKDPPAVGSLTGSIRPTDIDVGLLAGGSAYCNVYGGGAQETHFCASSLGWDELLTDQPWRLAAFLVWHSWSVVRTFGLLVIELVLSLGGFLRGTLRRREYLQELMMIPARVVVVILMRELATIGASLDVTRGLPIVQLNLMGYDELAHRRGPESTFAHWTLKGIDDAIRRLWKAAHRSAGREYDVWVYSDHGQEATVPYEYIVGKRIGQVATEVVADVCGGNVEAEVRPPAGDSRNQRQSGRARWLGASWIVSKLFGGENQCDTSEPADVQVAALGPLGLVYVNRVLSASQRLAIAERFVKNHSVPIAFVRHDDSVVGITCDGTYDLRAEPEHVFGSEHPFLADVATDMIELCRHPDAGEVVLSSWVRDGNPLSFATQNGAHAGPGTHETHAFVFLPNDVSAEADNHIRVRGTTYLRPNDLRQLAKSFLHSAVGAVGNKTNGSAPRPKRAASSATGNQQLKVLTYNVHSCVGMDGQLSLRRIARVIAQSGADVVALQELDVLRARSSYCDQAKEIAATLEMECQFHPALMVEDELYGDAILSRWPLRLVCTGELPSASERHEPRGAIWVEVELPEGQTVQVLNTHLSIYPRERRLQADAFASDWVQPAIDRGSTIVCGDFNATPRSPAYKCLSSILDDTQSYDNGIPPAATWFSHRPLARIDHIFATADIAVASTRVTSSRLARAASDHLPLLAELRIPIPAVTLISRNGKNACS